MDYEGKASSSPVWKIAQWNNYINNLKDAKYSLNKSVHTYSSKKGSALIIDTEKGHLTLQLNTSSEYGHSDTCPNNPRKAGEKWPHLLLEYSNQPALPLHGKKEIRMSVTYIINQIEDLIPDGLYNSSLHTAQFQWFVSVQNLNINSPGYKEYLWFGLCFYDNRYEFSPGHASQDTNTTSSFIYIPAMEIVMEDHTEIGKEMSVDVDILPYLKKGFEIAQNNNYMQNSKWEDLEISSSNIGWEVPGTYNVSVTIKNLDLKYLNE